MIHALVPVKTLATSKSRLQGDDAPAAAREALALAMLRDVLDALAASGRVGRRAVVTPDRRVAAVAVASGAEAVLHCGPGLRRAIEAGARALRPAAEDALLVVLGDVAGALPEDIDALCATLDGLPAPCAAQAPACDGGTAALLRRPYDAVPARFGPDSAKRHREAAAAAGVPLREASLPSLALDLDDARDVERFLQRADPRAGLHTRAALAAAGWSGAA